MKNFALLFVAFIFTFPALTFGQNEIVIGKTDSIESKILGENRKIMIYVPNEGPNSIFAKKKYPVVYLLDGDAHFTSVVGLIERFSVNNITPEMIVVAIPNTNRTRDLTPSKAEPNPPMVTQDRSEQSGGGKNFLAFIEKELMPYIDKTYPTEPYKMLIGHSFGGLFVMDALLEKPELFNSYISIDPSMWWDDKKLLASYKNTNLKDDKYKNKSLYLGIANTLEKGMDTVSVRQEKGPTVDHINSIFETRDLLKSELNNQILFRSKYYGNDTHNSAPLITTYDGMRFIFGFYQFNIDFGDIMDDDTDIVNEMKIHYAKVSKTLGYDNKPDESLLNRMGYQLMGMEKMDLANEFFQMNIAYYPKSFNVYDSLGDYYLAIENKNKAIESFEKALAIKENPDSRKKLDQLKSN
ncbi:MAG: alpha/beta hydrolase-fold protein [Psychroserpens sp.]|uniref:alpha/beta hydrolase-fold protein n=1 Tax=Psychroserpens sp. TaxID=2020870 RepID=UPI003001C9C7